MLDRLLPRTRIQPVKTDGQADPGRPTLLWIIGLMLTAPQRSTRPFIRGSTLRWRLGRWGDRSEHSSGDQVPSKRAIVKLSSRGRALVAPPSIVSHVDG
jgi:hypothetical protein